MAYTIAYSVLDGCPGIISVWNRALSAEDIKTLNETISNLRFEVVEDQLDPRWAIVRKGKLNEQPNLKRKPHNAQRQSNKNN